MIKHLFCDLDGTLIVNHQVSKADKEAIRHFVDQGGSFHIITGRTLAEIDQFVHLEDLPVEYRIGNNGCEIFKQNSLLLKEEINPQILSQLNDMVAPFAKQADFFEVTSKGKVYYPNRVTSEKFLKYKENNLVIEPNLFDGHLFSQGLTKMYMEADQMIVSAFLEMLDGHFGEDISHFGEITNVNVGPKGVSKGSAIRHLKQNIDLGQFAVIGDGANDIPMFKETDYSFSFHYARDMVTEKANYRVGSVAEAIDQLLNQL